MMPITDFLSQAYDRRVRVAISNARASRENLRHGLVAASNSTVTGIAHEVVPPRDKRALNKFLTEYDWDED
jgi:hypothetical protein